MGMTVLLFLSILALYLSSLYPVIAPEDSGEFVVAAWTLGIPHASGYPLYTLWGKLVTIFVPWGNPAYRVNLTSALSGAGMICLLFSALKNLLPTERRILPAGELESIRWRNTSVVLAVWLLAVSPLIWYISLFAEVYMLSAFLAVLLLWVMSRMIVLEREREEKESPFLSSARYLYCGAFLYGFSLAHHHTLVLWIPGLVLFLVLWIRGSYRSQGRKESFFHDVNDYSSPVRRGDHSNVSGTLIVSWRFFLFRLIGLTLFLFLLGYSIVLYLPVRAIQKPILNTGNPNTFERFVRVLSRADYGTTTLSRESGDQNRTKAIGRYSLSFSKAFTPFGAALVLIGLWVLFGKDRRRTWDVVYWLLCLWIFTGPIFLWMASPPDTDHFRGVIERFYPLTWIPLTVFLAVGIQQIGVWYSKGRSLLVVLVFAVTAFQYAGATGRNHFHAYNFGSNLLKSMPLGSLFYDPGDSAGLSIMALQKIWKVREDVRLILYHRTAWGQDILRESYPDLFPEKRIGFDPLFLSHLVEQPAANQLYTEIPRALPGLSDPERFGQITKFPRDGLPMGCAVLYFPSKRRKLVMPEVQLQNARIPFLVFRRSGEWNSSLYDSDPFTREIVVRYAESLTNHGQKFTQYDLYEEAIQYYREALSIDPSLMEAHNNMGVAHFVRERYGQAAGWFERAIDVSVSNPSLVRNLALSYWKSDQLEQASEAYARVLRMDANHVLARHELAQVLEKKEMFDQAQLEWEKVLVIQEDYWPAYTSLAQMHIKLGNTIAAEGLIERVLSDSNDQQEKQKSRELKRILQKKENN